MRDFETSCKQPCRAPWTSYCIYIIFTLPHQFTLNETFSFCILHDHTLHFIALRLH